MELINNDLLKYLEQHTSEEPPLLKQLNRETNANVLKPIMLSGHLQGRVLSMFSKMITPHKILEIGTYTGYSAICLAEGLAKGGRLITIDINEELESLVKSYFNKAGLTECIDYRIGNALNIIPTLDHDFDLVFIDADKSNYSNYYDLCFNKIRVGGYIIADNVLWKGKVVDESERSRDLNAIKEFNKKVQNDNRVENVVLPVRDGLMIVRKHMM